MPLMPDSPRCPRFASSALYAPSVQFTPPLPWIASGTLEPKNVMGREAMIHVIDGAQDLYISSKDKYLWHILNIR